MQPAVTITIKVPAPKRRSSPAPATPCKRRCLAAAPPCSAVASPPPKAAAAAAATPPPKAAAEACARTTPQKAPRGPQQRGPLSAIAAWQKKLPRHPGGRRVGWAIGGRLAENTSLYAKCAGRRGTVQISLPAAFRSARPGLRTSEPTRQRQPTVAPQTRIHRASLMSLRHRGSVSKLCGTTWGATELLQGLQG